MKTEIHTERAPRAIGPYSQAIATDPFIFTSGQVPVAPDGTFSPDIREQARQCIENVKAVLEAAGSGLDKVVKTTVFIMDMAQFGAINEVYSRYFTEPFPARSCVQVAGLPRGVSIEMEAVALK